MPAASAAAAASKTPHSTTSAAPTTSTVIQVPKTKPAASGDARYTLSSLVSATGQRDLGQGLFELERDKLLEINLTDGNQLAWIKKGTMVARRGNVKFSRQSTKEQGWKTVMTKVFSGDGITLVKCEGKGKVFVADTGKMVSIVQLRGESLSVNGNDVLAMSSGLRYNIKFMPGDGVMSAGLFNCRIAGSGLLAFTVRRVHIFV